MVNVAVSLVGILVGLLFLFGLLNAITNSDLRESVPIPNRPGCELVEHWDQSLYHKDKKTIYTECTTKENSESS
jgi:hypothetical protein